MHQPFYVSGPHNIGYLFAIVPWIFITVGTCSHWLSGGDFTVLARQEQCEQPLNNRCSYRYQFQKSDGQRYESDVGFPMFGGDFETYAIGNSIEKKRFTLAYTVNGHQVAWLPDRLLIGFSLFGLLTFPIARRLTPWKPARLPQESRQLRALSARVTP